MKSPAARAGAPARPRRYRQRARAAAAAATHRRILDAFVRFLGERWFEEITLEAVAAEAGVTAQTVIRRFGGKDGLLDAASRRLGGEIMQRRRVPEGASPEQAIAILVRDYEVDGDLVMRLLAQEERHPSLGRLLARGREGHRGWVADVFASPLAARPPRARRRLLDALVVATDLYTWQQLRRDRRRSARAVADTMTHLVAGALARPDPDTEKGR